MLNNHYLINKSNNLSPEPGQVKCSNVKSVQHDYAASRVIETFDQGCHRGLA